MRFILLWPSPSRLTGLVFPPSFCAFRSICGSLLFHNKFQHPSPFPFSYFSPVEVSCSVRSDRINLLSNFPQLRPLCPPPALQAGNPPFVFPYGGPIRQNKFFFFLFPLDSFDFVFSICFFTGLFFQPIVWSCPLLTASF